MRRPLRQPLRPPQRPRRLLPPTDPKYVILAVLAALLIAWLVDKFL